MKVRMTTALRACALALALAALPAAAAAQAPVPTDTVREIELADGSRVYGRILEEGGDRVVVETIGGVRMVLSRDQIRAVRVAPGRVVNGELWPDDPHTTRLLFAPTARAVPQGEGYFGVYELFFPFVTYGVTDRFTVSAGTPVIPEAIGEVFYLAPKYEVLRAPGASVAVGVLALFATQRAFDGTVGLLYGVGTFGEPDRALTVGATVPFYAASGDSEIGSDPVFMIGGESRLSRRTKFLTENYVSLGDGVLLSGGMRFFGERLSADFGLGAFMGEGESFCCMPLLNFVYTFGPRR
jgi:hypothetical protein